GALLLRLCAPRGRGRGRRRRRSGRQFLEVTRRSGLRTRWSGLRGSGRLRGWSRPTRCRVRRGCLVTKPSALFRSKGRAALLVGRRSIPRARRRLGVARALRFRTSCESDHQEEENPKLIAEERAVHGGRTPDRARPYTGAKDSFRAPPMLLSH